jgi:hypothetical protein
MQQHRHREAVIHRARVRHSQVFVLDLPFAVRREKQQPARSDARQILGRQESVEEEELPAKEAIYESYFENR